MPNDDLALIIANQAADIARLTERVEALTQLVGQLDLRLTALDGKTIHDHRERAGLRISEETKE